MSGLVDYLRFIVTLTAVVDPFLAVPFFLTFTAARSDAERRRRYDESRDEPEPYACPPTTTWNPPAFTPSCGTTSRKFSRNQGPSTSPV